MKFRSSLFKGLRAGGACSPDSRAGSARSQSSRFIHRKVKLNEVNAEIEKLQEQMMELLMKRNNGEITDKEYEQQSQQVGMKIDQLLMRKEEILSEQGKVQLASYRIEEVTKLLQTGKILEEFDRVMFKSLVRKITVLSNKEIEIEFECGITVRETL